MKKLVLTLIGISLNFVGLSSQKPFSQNYLFTYYSLESRLTGSIYTPCKKECDNSPLITADGSKINTRQIKKGKQRWVALSRDLLKRWGGKFNYGDSIYIEHPQKPELSGYWVVHDTMNARYKESIDFLQADTKNLGKWKGIKLLNPHQICIAH